MEQNQLDPVKRVCLGTSCKSLQVDPRTEIRPTGIGQLTLPVAYGVKEVDRE